MIITGSIHSYFIQHERWHAIRSVGSDLFFPWNFPECNKFRSSLCLWSTKMLNMLVVTNKADAFSTLCGVSLQLFVANDYFCSKTVDGDVSHETSQTGFHSVTTPQCFDLNGYFPESAAVPQISHVPEIITHTSVLSMTAVCMLYCVLCFAELVFWRPIAVISELVAQHWVNGSFTVYVFICALFPSGTLVNEQHR